MTKFSKESCEWIKGYAKAMGEIVDILKVRINKDSPATSENCILTVFHVNNWIGQMSESILEEMDKRNALGEETCK